MLCTRGFESHPRRDLLPWQAVAILNWWPESHPPQGVLRGWSAFSSPRSGNQCFLPFSQGKSEQSDSDSVNLNYSFTMSSCFPAPGRGLLSCGPFVHCHDKMLWNLLFWFALKYVVYGLRVYLGKSKVVSSIPGTTKKKLGVEQ